MAENTGVGVPSAPTFSQGSVQSTVNVPPARESLSIDQAVERLRNRSTGGGAAAPTTSGETTLSVPTTSDVTAQSEVDESAIEQLPGDKEESTAQTEAVESAPTLAPESVVFTLDDGTTVTLSEARKAYVARKEFQADYTRKTTELSQSRQRLDANAQVTFQAANFFADVLPLVMERAQQAIPAEPDPSTWGTEQFNSQWIARRQALEQLQHLDVLRQQAAEHQQQVQQQSTVENFQHQYNMLLEKRPAWRDEKVRVAEQEMMTNYAKSMGFNDQELAITDHRLIPVLLDAVIGAKVRKGGYKGVAAKAAAGVMNPTLSPGQTTGQNPRVSTQAQAREALRQTAMHSKDGHERMQAAIQLLGPRSPNGAGPQRR